MNRRDFLRGSLPLWAIVGGPEGPPYIWRGHGKAILWKSRERANDSDVGRPFRAASDNFVAEAERLKPSLARTVHTPASIVEPASDASAFLRWRMNKTAAPDAIESRLFKPGESVILDFGTHLTGHFAISLRGEGRGIDAPARLKFTFGEVPGEVAEPFDPYKGWLSRAWLQDEVINVDVLPATLQLPRRYAFRYVKIEVVATSPNYALRMADPTTTALTSGSGLVQPLAASAPESLRRIDDISVLTLRECMQTVFEDGPKRDRRLWIGDLRLQALTNYVTIRNFDLVKRCLLLFAGLPRDDGLVPACVFEDPTPLRGHEYIMDYAALYAAAVVDYAKASNDWDTAVALWPTVKRQMELVTKYVSSDGVFADPGGWWIFIDWSDPLERTAAMHGVLLYSPALRADAGATRGCARKRRVRAADREDDCRRSPRVLRRVATAVRQRPQAPGVVGDAGVDGAVRCCIAGRSCPRPEDGQRHRERRSSRRAVPLPLRRRRHDPVRHAVGSDRLDRVVLGRDGESRCRHLLGGLRPEESDAVALRQRPHQQLLPRLELHAVVSAAALDEAGLNADLKVRATADTRNCFSSLRVLVRLHARGREHLHRLLAVDCGVIEQRRP